MKSNVLVRQIARKTALTSLAGVCLMPQDHGGIASQPLLVTQSATTDANRFQEPRTITRSDNVTLTFRQTSKEWTKTDEKEFKRLALKEVTGNISDKELRSLNMLSWARDHQLNPLSAEEILLQIRRDRILEKMAAILEDYVEFTESTGNKGTSA
jgi:hypothetical protein